MADVAEGVAVRAALTAAGVNQQPRILVMCGLLREDVDDVVRHKLTPVVWNRQQMEWLVGAAERLGDGRDLACAFSRWIPGWLGRALLLARSWWTSWVGSPRNGGFGSKACRRTSPVPRCPGRG